ncbi:MAG TPA: preprotein translocase subunit YajC [Verrucomicrobiae bacterium]|nr:preprotein translocase subunit YajC [Verrucomicrobiae bacterium]
MRAGGEGNLCMMDNVMNMYLLQAGPAGGSLGIFLLPLLFIIAMFYFQQRKTKRWQEVLSGLKNGDRVTTSGGIRGLVIALKDDAVHLRVPPDNLRLEVAKSSITAINREEEEKKPA